MSKKMSAKRFSELLTQLAETQEGQAKALGIGRRSVIRYTNNQLPVPPVVRRLLLSLVAHGPVRSKEW